MQNLPKRGIFLFLGLVAFGCGGPPVPATPAAAPTPPLLAEPLPNPCLANPCAARVLDPGANPCAAPGAPAPSTEPAPPSTPGEAAGGSPAQP
jgi:hypothetical protein